MRVECCNALLYLSGVISYDKGANKMSKYNPMSKEFQEEAKRLGLTGYQYTQKLREEDKLPNPLILIEKNLKEL